MNEVATRPDVCFLVCPLGEIGSDIRRKADWLEKYLVEPVMQQSGLQVLRADKLRHQAL
jgi:hypothetical protein